MLDLELSLLDLASLLDRILSLPAFVPLSLFDCIPLLPRIASSLLVHISLLRLTFLLDLMFLSFLVELSTSSSNSELWRISFAASNYPVDAIDAVGDLTSVAALDSACSSSCSLMAALLNSAEFSSRLNRFFTF